MKKCKAAIVSVLDTKNGKTVYEVAKETYYSIGSVHRYMQELYLENKVKIKKKESQWPHRKFYVLL